MSILAVLACALPLLPQDDPALTPKLADCRLVVGAKELAATRASEGTARVQSEAGWELEFLADEIAIRRAGTQASTGKVKAHPSLSCLAVAGDQGWFIDQEAREPELRRLDLAKASWQPRLVLDDALLGIEKQPASSSRVTCLLADGAALFALREDLVGGQSGPPERSGHVIARLAADSCSVLWARRFPCVRSEVGARAFLMAPMLAYPERSATRALQRFGAGLLVCATGAESIVLLETAKGETTWSVDRLWEYQRGYIGPSVWSHYLGRFGIDSFGGEDEARKKAIEDARMRFDALYGAAVTAGPFVVRKNDPWGKPELAALVMVSLSPHDPWAEQLTQPFVYEIDARGKPCSVVATPRAALGWAAAPNEDEVVFACMHGGFGCVSTTANTGDIGSVGTAPDATGALRWYCEPVPAQHAAWMSCDPAGDPVALDARLGVRPAGGGWIEKQGEHTFHFPLWLVDPRNGGVREVELRLPFEGEMTAPVTNFQSDGKTMHTWGARGLGLTQLRLDGDRLIVWLANTKRAWQLEFDARELVPAK